MNAIRFMLTHNCARCSFRAKYDSNPKSILGRIWRWHIRFCPGWKAYMKSLPVDERSELEKSYSLRKAG
jgi:hypothetical protein